MSSSEPDLPAGGRVGSSRAAALDEEVGDGERRRRGVRRRRRRLDDESKGCITDVLDGCCLGACLLDVFVIGVIGATVVVAGASAVRSLI